jgi:predicted secreted hydrolase
LARASAGVDEKWGLKIKNAPILGEKCRYQRKFFVRASAGVDKNGLQKSKMYLYCAKMQVLESRENFGQGFRRGRRKLGSNTQKYTCFGLYVDENWVLRSKINLVFD